MVDIHVEAHADRIGGDQEIDLLFLVERHLGVAGARRQPAHHHRTAAAAAADQLGDGIDLACAEGDHRAARRQADQLGRPRAGQLRQPRPGLDLGLRHQPAQQRADGLGTQEHRLHQAARVQQPIGEDMAAIGIGAELDLVDGDELDRAVERHRLHRAGEPGRIRRDDLLLAGDQRHPARAAQGHHPVVILACQQAERKADDARGMGGQPLHREMRLARVGRAEHRLHPRGESLHGTSLEAEAPEIKSAENRQPAAAPRPAD